MQFDIIEFLRSARYCSWLVAFMHHRHHRHHHRPAVMADHGRMAHHVYAVSFDGQFSHAIT